MKSTPVFLPGKSHRQRGLMAYSPWGRIYNRSYLAGMRKNKEYFLQLSKTQIRRMLSEIKNKGRMGEFRNLFLS